MIESFGSALAWVCLLLAGLAEVAGVFSMKKFSDTNKKILGIWKLKY